MVEVVEMGGIVDRFDILLVGADTGPFPAADVLGVREQCTAGTDFGVGGEQSLRRAEVVRDEVGRPVDVERGFLVGRHHAVGVEDTGFGGFVGE